MDNDTSLAAQAVAAGPQTIAPPSFDGHGWLVVLNLAAMTAATIIAMMAVAVVLTEAWRGRERDVGLAPARLWRIALLLFATGIGLRCGVEALTLWAWDPRTPVATARFLIAKRLVDPVAVACGISGLALSVLSLPGVLEQLRREPLTDRIWQTWPIIRRMILVVLLSLVAAIGVVSTR
jgi:hypothetical protein